MSTNFTHLHLHTQYSLLDGAIRFKELFAKCKEFGMESVAITDHGAMYGALEFYLAAREAKIKPIIGCEFYIAPGSRHEKANARSAGGAAFHLVLLAMNLTGYKNLMKLASLAQTEGFYYKPRIDKEVLYAHQGGLIAMSACLHGEIPHLITSGNVVAAKKVAEEYRTVFGDRFYFEIQENNIPEQTTVNRGLLALSEETGIPVVATNDCHYLTREQCHAHEVLLCVQTGKTIDDASRFRFSTDQLYFKSPDEMTAAFSYCPEAVARSVEIAARCNLEIPLGNYYFPILPVHEGDTLEAAFMRQARSGLEKRCSEISAHSDFSPEQRASYQKQLGYEIDVICRMGFAGYFLIVADFINWAKDHNIPVGPGRGSGAGSLAAYCLRITDIDPLPYGLIFERFLNVERKSMPDFDVDFCQDRRGEVIQYVQQKYGGSEYVAQIATFGAMKTKLVIRDVGRALGMAHAEVDKIAKLVPDKIPADAPKNTKMSIPLAVSMEPKLQEARKRDPKIAELLDIAQVLEGLPRQVGTHAAGVVISPTPMTDYLPVCRGSKGSEIITQYDMKRTEKTGLVKFDFLGLKTLTVIHRALALIEKDFGRHIDLAGLRMDDAKTYDLLCRGDALGIFQLESSGMRSLLMSLKPEVFTDLIALVALYRPGPLGSGMVQNFVDTKHGRKQAVYALPQLEPILKETYGVIVYQEQVMQIASTLASYSLGDADNLRRAMGKKEAEVMAKEKSRFLAGAEKNSIPMDKAAAIFDLMEKFAEYGFNKSHSAAYALITYQTAYLKAHYPAQFMAALLSCEMSDTKKVVIYINDCKEHRISVLPPDINESEFDFTVVKGAIRFGLAAVKNVGGAALESIIDERRKDGPYDSLEDFCVRVDSRKVNRRVIESLIKAGAFDSFGAKRPQLNAIIDQAMEQAHTMQRRKQSNQISLFAAFGDGDSDGPLRAAKIALPDIADWPDKERLALEKECVGFYLTGHPLNEYLADLQSVATHNSDTLSECGEGQKVRIGGIVQTMKEHINKKGERMAFVTIEDNISSVEVLVMAELYRQCSQVLSQEGPIVIQGAVLREEKPDGTTMNKIMAHEVTTLGEADTRYITRAHITLQADQVDRPTLEKVKQFILDHHGPCPVLVTIDFPGQGEVDIEPNADYSIKPGREFKEKIDGLLGHPAVHYNRAVRFDSDKEAGGRKYAPRPRRNSKRGP